MTSSSAWHLVKRPEGVPQESCFELRDFELPVLQDGDLLIANRWMSVDPYMRGRMAGTQGYDPFPLGTPLEGAALGEVLESRSPRFRPGDVVVHAHGWRDKAVVAGQGLLKVRPGVPEQAYLGVLGMPAVTGYFGLLDIAAMKAGDVVFVSGAAGAVGSTVVQLAKAKGASRVIGSAGGPEKTQWLKDIGCDAVIDYKAVPDLEAALAAAAPDGIDVYFDNVGGNHLFAALACAKPFARFAECGMIGQYASGPAASPPDLMQITVKRVRIQGFGGADFYDRMAEFYRDMTPLVLSGQIKSRETVSEGLASAPRAFRGLFQGENIGKMLVKIA